MGDSEEHRKRDLVQGWGGRASPQRRAPVWGKPRCRRGERLARWTAGTQANSPGSAAARRWPGDNPPVTGNMAKFLPAFLFPSLLCRKDAMVTCSFLLTLLFLLT